MSGLTVDAGSQNVEVSQNIFRDLSGGGVQAGQVLDHAQADPTKYNADILVTDNLFYGMPMEYHSCAPLLGGYLSHSSFVHNTILDPANTGISLGWGWSRQPSYANNNNIIGNLVSGSNWLLVDGGSIYTLGPQPNSSVAYNYARCVHRRAGPWSCTPTNEVRVESEFVWVGCPSCGVRRSQRQLYGSLYHGAECPRARDLWEGSWGSVRGGTVKRPTAHSPSRPWSCPSSLEIAHRRRERLLPHAPQRRRGRSGVAAHLDVLDPQHHGRVLLDEPRVHD